MATTSANSKLTPCTIKTLKWIAKEFGTVGYIYNRIATSNLVLLGKMMKCNVLWPSYFLYTFSQILIQARLWCLISQKM